MHDSFLLHISKTIQDVDKNFKGFSFGESFGRFLFNIVSEIPSIAKFLYQVGSFSLSFNTEKIDDIRMIQLLHHRNFIH